MPARCLGEGSYSARFVRRATKLGPAVPLGEADPLGGSWARAINSTTDASVTFGLGNDGPDCARLLRRLDPWRDELELYREASRDELVWAGPVMDVLANPESATATVTAKDSSAWWSMRRLPTIVSRQLDLAVIFERYIEACFLVDDPGFSIVATPTGILGDRTVAASDLKLLAGELAELAKTGVDWTVAARTFFVGGQEISAGMLPGRLVDEHFRSAPQTRRSGVGQVNDAAVRGNAVQGFYGGPDPSDGVLLQGVSDENSIEDQGSADASAESWWDRAHEPLAYLEGDNALDPSAPIEIQQLIPGVRALVDVLGGGVVPLLQELRLEKLSADFGPDGEKITVGLQPVGTVAS